MLQFPEKFFLDELRDGFMVDSVMKSAWAAELEVLYVVAGICEKYQLPWYVDWGTLLGAVRHKGFIPWDDDMDITMMREDYDVLMEVLPRELPKGWVACGSKGQEKLKSFWGCVYNSDSVSISPERLKRFHGCPFIVGVDIIPLDYLPQEKAERDLEEALYRVLINAIRLLSIEHRNATEDAELKEAFNGIEDFFSVKLERERYVPGDIWELANDLCRSFGGKKGGEVVCYPTYVEKGRKCVFLKEWFDDVSYLTFEGLSVPAPIGWDDLLQAEYGNYNIYEKNTQSHEYPFYKRQLGALKELRDRLIHGNVGREE